MRKFTTTALGRELTISYITDTTEAKKALERYFTERVIGFDTETTGLSPLDSTWRLVQLCTEDGQADVLDMKALGHSIDVPLTRLLEAEYPVKVCHNAKFDIKFARHELKDLTLFGRVYDSMLAAQLLAFGDQSVRVGLAESLLKFCDESISKDEQLSDWTAKTLDNEQIVYAGIDPYAALRLRQAQLPQLIENELINACKIEFGAVDAIATMELNGFYLDPERWIEQMNTSAEHEALTRAEVIDLALPTVDPADCKNGIPVFNPRSPKQLLTCLNKMGVPVPVEKGKQTTSGWRIKHLANDYPIIKALLEFREWSKRKSCYGEAYLDFINPTTGRVHADFRQIGALTGRMSVNRPNLQQLPSIDMFRRCFTNEFEDTRLIVADYSAIELRILADYSKEPNFVNAFLNNEDLHTLTGCRLFNTTPDKLTKAQRNFAKTINFGIAYGMGPQTLSIRTGETKEYSQAVLNTYRDQNPVLCEWLDAVAAETVRSRQVRTYSGRLAKFNFNPRDRNAVGEAERNGKNTPPQGGCADIVKLALHLLHKEIHKPEFRRGDGWKIKLVNVVHDEIVLETDVDVTEVAGEILSRCMETAGSTFIKTVPVIADYEVLTEWIKS